MRCAGDVQRSPTFPPTSPRFYFLDSSDHDSDSSVFDTVKSPTSQTSIDAVEQNGIHPLGSSSSVTSGSSGYKYDRLTRGVTIKWQSGQNATTGGSVGRRQRIANSGNELCERVEHVDPLDRTENSRADPIVSPDRVTRAFHYDVIARNHSNMPKEVSLQRTFYISFDFSTYVKAETPDAYVTASNIVLKSSDFSKAVDGVPPSQAPQVWTTRS
ncbi:hypothetical protein EVAR_65669_1 [Eumeta japonica]|uniref:Uncharacterized protein n=1 Tax=Eumeta variegata TaxID=151549 RepID=A0A4C2A581_EUMVA|nr:hypothetical protein EVAR_65669_1 [Eumeta japonica]